MARFDVRLWFVIGGLDSRGGFDDLIPSSVREALGIALFIAGFGVLLYLFFGPPTRTYSPQLQQLIIPLLVIGLALTVGGALLHQWSFRGKGHN